jgi:hypothetical protein
MSDFGGNVHISKFLNRSNVAACIRNQNNYGDANVICAVMQHYDYY